MKDLYKRNRLHALESNLVQIHNCKSDNPDDNEAAFAILLNKERKQGYDKVFTTLSVIGRLRQEFNIEGNNNWSNKYSDFAHQSHVDTRKIEKAAPSNNTENQQKLNFKFQYLAYGAVLLLVVLVGFSFNQTNESEEPTYSNGDEETVLKHVAASGAFVREQPNETAKVINELRRFDDITVLKGKSSRGWDVIERDEKRYYINSQLLEIGSGYEPYLQSCQSSSINQPKHGDVLFNAFSGPHSLIVVNPPGMDAVVKLKDRRGQLVLMYYVAGGNTLSLDNIPNGVFSLSYAIGEEFNAGCKHFIQNARAWRERGTVNFRTRLEGQLEYHTSHLLSLKNALSDARPIDLRYF